MSSARESQPLSDRVTLWILVRLNRKLLIGLVLSGVFLTLAAFSQAGLTPLRKIIQSHSGIRYIFAAFIGSIVTGTAIVVTINQLVLSQELGAFGDQRDRMENSMEFRREIESEIGIDASPSDPSAFLSVLTGSIEQRAEDLSAAVADRSAATDAIDDYVSNLTDSTDDLQQSLSGAEFGTFDLIWRALRFDYSRRLNEARRLRADYEETLDEDANEALDDVIQRLIFFGPVREHIKTLYFQWELINLSRAMLYLSVPALAVIGIFLMYVDLGAVTGSTLGIDNLVWVASAGFVVGMSPFVVFISYILRIITVAKLTLAIGPFTLQGERDE